MSTRGIHAIWTTFLTWPPGDERGHWSPLFDTYGRIIERGGSLNMPDRETKRRSLALADEPPKILTPREIGVVADTLGEIVRRAPGMPGAICGLRIVSAAIEPTHVHLLLGAMPHDIHDAVGRLKSQASSAILRLPENTHRKRTWTSGFWKVFLYDDIGMECVGEYVDDHNRRRGLDPKPYAWIERCT